ncbi:MAG: trypsin-like peptidase domain-containing protein [Ardenticatenaceae bacterium]|nr:trypsin-like peptidase domain-containing protein [Anaerolineales bacterium]MCB8921445.1 trypsin-like peptidase domain-containing protein [Ardenticatenaceae bacterium]MCB8991562.1 trypsin-like peptidase domain-containing protein [Ardenticatenaceae bacterium]
MNKLQRGVGSLWVMVVLVLMSACGAETAVSTDPALIPINEPAATTTIDTDAIVETVLSQVTTKLAEESEVVPVVNDSGTAVSLAADTLQDTLINVYQQANPAVVYIIVPQIGSGSGFVYSSDGYIVTNNHVVESGRSYEIVFANGERAEAELVGTDVDSDLAVLKVDDLPTGITPLPLAEFDTLQVGEFVVAIGNPFGEQGSMSLGIVSALGRSLPSQRDLGTGSTYSLPEVIQTDAPINPGNSGGPLLNLQGEVVGVNSAIASTTGTNSGVGFSIPVAAVQKIVPSLIADGRYTYPYMGVGFDDEVSLDEQAVYGVSQTQGAYVLTVTSGSPAARAGLVAANLNTGKGGDLVIAIDGQTVNNFSDLNSYLVFHANVGDTVDVVVLRDGETVVLPLTLGERP